MARQPKKQKPQTRDIASILNNSADRAKLENFVDEAVRCKMKIADEQESIKGLREEAVEKTGIEPKMFNIWLSLKFNNNYTEKQTEVEKVETLIEMLLMNSKGSNAND